MRIPALFNRRGRRIRLCRDPRLINLQVHIIKGGVREPIAEIVPGSELPSQDYQSNCGEVGMNYAFVEDGLVVLLANEWTLFEPIEHE